MSRAERDAEMENRLRRRRLEESTARSGVPLLVEDPLVIERAVTLLHGDAPQSPAEERAA